MVTDSTFRPSPSAPQLRIFLAAHGKHLFQRLSDERLVFYPHDWDGDLVPDLVVFPCSQTRDYSVFGDDLPDQVRRRIESGEARVVFDASSEGLDHTPARTGAVHSVLERLGAPFGRAVYITQHRGFPEDYEAFCTAAGMSQRMTILNYDYWIKRLVMPYEIKGKGFLARRRALFQARARSRPRRFLSLNRSPRPSKLVFLLSLLRDGLWDQGYVSFGGFDQLERMKLGHVHRLIKTVRNLDGFAELVPELSPFLQPLADMGVIEFNVAMPETPLKIYDRHTNDLALAEYHQSWFTAVTESEMSPRPARVTEKVFKPLLNFHPFVVFGNPGSLGFLRGLGFETFPEMFDETYDQVETPRARFDMAYAQLARLCRMDEAELSRLEAAVAGKLEHNARVALTELPRRYREEFDRDLVDWFLPASPATASTAPHGDRGVRTA